MSTAPLVVRSSPWRYALLLVPSVAFVAMGAVLVTRTPHAVVGWLNLGFFGLCTVVFLWQIVDRRPRLVIDERGVFDRTLGVGIIPWSEIVAVEARAILDRPFVMLTLRDPALFTRRLSPLRRSLTRGNRALGFEAVNLNLSGLSVGAAQVVARLQSGLAARGPVGQNPPA